MLNRNDLRRADISLLVVFETMMQEQNVSRVGDKLFLGQPSVSNALNRLRAMFDDPLFIRNGRIMEPTARAEELYQLLTPALDTIAVALSQTCAFDPATSESTFHIGLSDDAEYGLLPEVLHRLRQEAPGIKLVIHRTDSSRMPSLLGNGEISIGISHTSDLPANAKRKFLRMIQPMVLRADAAKGRLSLDEFCRRPHVAVTSMATLNDDAQRALKRLNRAHKVVLAVPQFSGLSTLLANSDLLAVVPDYIADAVTANSGLIAEFAPVELPALELSMVWRGVSHNDPGERWLRSRFSEYLSDHRRHPLAIAAA